jgi:hypothetical protein
MLDLHNGFLNRHGKWFWASDSNAVSYFVYSDLWPVVTRISVSPVTLVQNIKLKLN